MTTEPRWYMVNKDGMATLCTDKADAQQEAADAQSVWPHMGPHRAVQLVEAPETRPRTPRRDGQGHTPRPAADARTFLGPIMKNQQWAPEALRLAELLELAPEDGIEPQTTEDAAAELRRLHAENEALASKLKAYEDLDEAASDVQILRMGYAAARLALVQYGAHDGACSVGDLDDEGRHCACDCGYESAIKAAEDKALNA